MTAVIEPLIRTKVNIPSGGQMLIGELFIPNNVCGLALLIPGSSLAAKPEGEVVAYLHAKGFATLALASGRGKNSDDYTGYCPAIDTEALIDATMWSKKIQEYGAPHFLRCGRHSDLSGP